MEFGFCDGEVFLPIGEAEFGFEISWLADDQANQMGFGIGFEQDFADLLISGVGFAFRHAAQDIVVRVGWVVFGVFGFCGVHYFDGAAEFREVRLPC